MVVRSHFRVDERACRSVLIGRVKMNIGGVTRFLSIASSLMVMWEWDWDRDDSDEDEEDEEDGG